MPLILLFLIAWLICLYIYAGQLSASILKTKQKEVSRNKILFISLLITPVLSYALGFLFLFLVYTTSIPFPDWVFIFVMIVCCIIIPFMVPKMVAVFLSK
ncbi:MAG: hypothetical protein JWP12_1288 [Bacteroidetes bacterium]|nr:hypothetical protein [Bacteroidota bacterium]